MGYEVIHRTRTYQHMFHQQKPKIFVHNERNKDFKTKVCIPEFNTTYKDIMDKDTAINGTVNITTNQDMNYEGTCSYGKKYQSTEGYETYWVCKSEHEKYEHLNSTEK